MPTGQGYKVEYVDHSQENPDTKKLPLISVSCNKLVIAAGTLGTTFLMLKNQHFFPGLSPRLGHAIGGNGDILGLALNARNTQGNHRVIDMKLPWSFISKTSIEYAPLVNLSGFQAGKGRQPSRLKSRKVHERSI
jgi:hypothetical protein